MLFHVTRFPCYLKRTEEFDSEEECNEFNLQDATHTLSISFSSICAEFCFFFPPLSSLMHLSLEPGISNCSLRASSRTLDRFASKYDIRRVFSAFANSYTNPSRPTRRLRKTGGDLDDIRVENLPLKGTRQSSKCHGYMPPSFFHRIFVPPSCFCSFPVPTVRTDVRSISLYRRIITSLDINHRPIVIVPRVSRCKNRVRDV